MVFTRERKVRGTSVLSLKHILKVNAMNASYAAFTTYRSIRLLANILKIIGLATPGVLWDVFVDLMWQLTPMSM